MRDIGKSRRKFARRETSLQFTLEVPNDQDIFNGPPKSTELDHVIGSVSPVNVKTASNLANQSAVEPDGSCMCRTPKLNSSRTLRTGSAIPSFDRLWTGRMDPFIKYPVEMDDRSLQLMDHLFDDRYGNTPPFRDTVRKFSE
jgi:hypothetical protein